MIQFDNIFDAHAHYDDGWFDEDRDSLLEKLPELALPMTMYWATTRDLSRDTLVSWLCAQNWDLAQRARIPGVLADYHVGTTRDGSGFTIFWLLDENGVLRTGKMLRYKYNGHRFKSDEVKYNSDWIHSRLFNSDKWPQYDRERQDWKRTYYGMHLLKKYPNAEVCIVESEKTALLMAIAYGNNTLQVWLACGSKVYLTHERLKPLIDAGRKIVLYPDRDAVEEWKQTARAIGYGRLSVNAEPVLRWWQPEDGEHADVADVVLRLTNTRPPQAKPMQVGEAMPEALQTLIDRLQLRPE